MFYIFCSIVLIVLLLNRKNIVTNASIGVRFSNSPSSKKEYEARKKRKEEIATNDFYFWKAMDKTELNENKYFYEKGICPYCKQEVEAQKNRAFKCKKCENKIYKRTHPLSQKKYIYCTEQEIQKVDSLYSTYHKRKNFLEIYQYIDKIIIPNPTLEEIGNMCKTEYTDDKIQNIQILIKHLHFAKKYCSKPEYVDEFRTCQFFEGEIQTLFGTIEQATNAYMKTLYIDLWGSYNGLFSKKTLKELETTKEELINDGEKEWLSPMIAPGIISRAFKENLAIDRFKEIFLFNAETLLKSIKYKPPITPDEAWAKIEDYRKGKDYGIY